MSKSIPVGGLSYDFLNKIRDVDEVFRQLVSSAPIFLSLIGQGPQATNTKHEWMEDSVAPITSAIASFDTDGDGTGVNVANTSGLVAGSIVGFRKATGASLTEICKVASVDSGTALTLVRDYGSSTGVTLVVGDVLFLISSPKTSGTDATPDLGQEAGTMFNYVEIFDRTAKVSKTSEAVKMYGVSSAINTQVEFQMKNIAYNLNNAAIYGRKVARSASENGTMGGILQFLEGGISETTGGAISSTILNNVLEQIYGNGAFSPRLALLMNTNQARKVSTFLTAANQPVIQKVDAPTQSAGFAIDTFRGDLPTASGQFTTNVVVDPNFPKDQIAVVDMNKVEINALRTMTDENAAQNGSDYFARRILLETTMTVKDGKTAHGLITGLDL
jgi:hypothetical protein